MEVRLTPDQQAFVRQGISSGRFHRGTDAVAEAPLLWEERERARAEILAAVDVAEASLAGGEGGVIDEQSRRELAEAVKPHGRARLAAETFDLTLMSHRGCLQVEAEVGEIWLYMASESGSIDAADRLFDLITDHFLLRSEHPHLGRPATI